MVSSIGVPVPRTSTVRVYCTHPGLVSYCCKAPNVVELHGVQSSMSTVGTVCTYCTHTVCNVLNLQVLQCKYSIRTGTKETDDE